MAEPNTEEKQLVIIGAGPGGYAAAFYAADKGLNVTLVDDSAEPGGVCLKRGCIPSKALLHAAKIIELAESGSDYGVSFSRPEIDIDKLRSKKEEIVSKLTGGLKQLTRQRKIEYVEGRAIFTGSNSLEITYRDRTTGTIQFKNAIIATGSIPVTLPLPQDDRIIDSTGALDLKDIPSDMLVIGGGYIGLEMATVYAALGSQVTVVEMADKLLMGADADLVRPLEARLKKKFKEIKTKVKVDSINISGDKVKVSFEPPETNPSAEFDKVLVSAGRKPNTANLGLDVAGIELTEKNFIKVNEKNQTTVPGVYAIGDCATEPMLAHKASHEGRAAVDQILGSNVIFDPACIPAVVFTDPEIAWCGVTETEMKDKNIEATVLRFPWAASGRAITLNRTKGFTKLIADKENGRLLGAAITGEHAAEMIGEMALAIEMGAVAQDIGLTIHPHPTLSETLMEAADIFEGISTHIYRPK